MVRRSAACASFVSLSTSLSSSTFHGLLRSPVSAAAAGRGSGASRNNASDQRCRCELKCLPTWPRQLLGSGTGVSGTRVQMSHGEGGRSHGRHAKPPQRGGSSSVVGESAARGVQPPEHATGWVLAWQAATVALSPPTALPPGASLAAAPISLARCSRPSALRQPCVSAPEAAPTPRIRCNC